MADATGLARLLSTFFGGGRHPRRPGDVAVVAKALMKLEGSYQYSQSAGEARDRWALTEAEEGEGELSNDGSIGGAEIGSRAGQQVQRVGDEAVVNGGGSNVGLERGVGSALDGSSAPYGAGSSYHSVAAPHAQRE